MRDSIRPSGQCPAGNSSCPSGSSAEWRVHAGPALQLECHCSFEDCFSSFFPSSFTSFHRTSLRLCRRANHSSDSFALQANGPLPFVQYLLIAYSGIGFEILSAGGLWRPCLSTHLRNRAMNSSRAMVQSYHRRSCSSLFPIRPARYLSTPWAANGSTISTRRGALSAISAEDFPTMMSNVP